MENPTKQTHLLIFAISCLLLSTSVSTSKDDNEGFNYDPCSERGPKHWGDIKEEWAECKKGKMQSPIDLFWETADVNRDLGELRRNHRPADAILKNNGHEVTVKWIGNAGSIKINNTNYYLQNYHWHHPSEHTRDGKRFPLELHMVHTNYGPNVTNNIAVIGVLFEFGQCDPFLSKIERDIKVLNIEGGERYLGKVDPRVVRLDGLRYFRYMGSLTTPPCTEGVIWTVMEQVKTVSPSQVELLKQAVAEENNARPLQDINGRDVFYFKPYYWRGSAAE